MVGVEIFQVQSSVPVGLVWHFPTEEERGIIFLFKDLQVKMFRLCTERLSVESLSVC